MSDHPYCTTIQNFDFQPSYYDNHIIRHLSDLKGQFLDQNAYENILKNENPILYEVFENKRPETEGELLSGISIVYPGKIGNEFFMTKGHFHSVLETAEIYYCLHGEGYMVMETLEGDTAIEALSPGKVLYVPPRWAHRSVCTSRQEKLVTYFIYPAHAGHDYKTIEDQGFRKLVVESNKGIDIIDNPNYEVTHESQ